MFKVHPLYSSSSGNMFHIASSSSNILIDVGVSYKAVNEGLKSIGLTLNDIDAIFITHEHIDHIKALPLLCRKNNIPIFACTDTAEYLKKELDQKNIASNINAIDYDMPVKVKDIVITPFETSHDALMPCGYTISNDQHKISFATDLGYMSPVVFDSLKSSDFTILESNYDTTMLEFGKYPYPLKNRIKGIKGHLSNDVCAETISKLIQDGQSRFLIAHMSENNNNIEIAKQTMDYTLKSNAIDMSTIEINYASKALSSEEYVIC